MATSFALSGTGLSIATLSPTATTTALAVTRTYAAAMGVTTAPGDAGLNSHQESNLPYSSDYRVPFYTSTFPICYALAATTVTSYMLLIMLLITPRSFLDGGVVYLGRKGGFTHSSSGGDNIGGRPWLQKIATLTVAVSLTIASHDTFKVAAEQYKWGAQNARVLQVLVMGSVELRVIRLVSNFFLWLAQAQTLIRLFPRHREKVIIKWVAFALITLDLIFSAINSFKPGESGEFTQNNGKPMEGGFKHPIPALSYMFQLLLGVLYAAWVIYYAIMKKRYAFYHPLMKNMCLLAVVSICAVLIPVVFFIVDISKPEFAVWGDYVRWVGAAAASVIVWEWVERIESLEREGKKGGILGREVFDGDEVLEVSASYYPWGRNHKFPKDGHNGMNGHGGGGERERDSHQTRQHSRGNSQSHGDDHHRNQNGSAANHAHLNGWASRARGQEQRAQDANGQHHHHPILRSLGENLRPHWPTRPAAAITPVSRTDTPSAASTVYAVRYPPSSEATGRTPDILSRTPDPFPPPIPPAPSQLQQQQTLTGEQTRSNGSAPTSGHTEDDHTPPSERERSPPSIMQNVQAMQPSADHSVDLEANATVSSTRSGRWRTSAPVASRRSPDGSSQAETTQRTVSSAATTTPDLVVRHDSDANRWDIKSRFEMFAANQADKIREKFRPTTNTDNLPVTFIPAPPRQGAALQQVLEEEEQNGNLPEMAQSRGSGGVLSGILGRRDSGNVNASRDASNPDNPAAPPLWPGVRRRIAAYEDDDESSFDDESSAVTSSANESAPHESENESSQIPREAGRQRLGEVDWEPQ